MNADSPAPSAPQESLEAAQPKLPDNSDTIHFKSEGDRLLLTLPSSDKQALDWQEITQQLQLRLNAGGRFWQPHTQVELICRDRLLDQRQLQALANVLSGAQLQLQRVRTSRRQTAIVAATAGYAVEQEVMVTPLKPALSEVIQPLADPLYLEATVRSGTEIRHAGSVIVIGDLNPGGAVIADGDILVWGRLRGIAHAGAQGNPRCRIMSLQMEATQLRIANQVARTPKPPAEFYPEVAYVTADGIRLARAVEFGKTLFVQS
jgi:septum site-determining protein MinC